MSTDGESLAKRAKSSRSALPSGVWPTMITPFVEDHSAIDWPVLDAMVEWYISSGCTGLFACCQSSEMYELSPDERLELARHVAKRAAGRVAVVACGTFGGPVEEQASFVNRMAAEVDAVVVLTCQLAAEAESDEVWTTHVSKLLELTGETPLGLYEVPVPYKRLMTPEQLRWAAGTGRFLFHKDTCCDSAGIAAKIDAIRKVEGTNFRFYNANVETLMYSNGLGGAGFSGISANFYPWLHVRLCSADCSKEDKARIQRFLSIAEVALCDGYPRSAKAYLAQYEGFRFLEATRKEACKHMKFNEVQRLHLRHMKELMEDLCTKSLDVPIVPLAPVMLT